MCISQSKRDKWGVKQGFWQCSSLGRLSLDLSGAGAPLYFLCFCLTPYRYEWTVSECSPAISCRTAWKIPAPRIGLHSSWFAKTQRHMAEANKNHLRGKITHKPRIIFYNQLFLYNTQHTIKDNWMGEEPWQCILKPAKKDKKQKNSPSPPKKPPDNRNRSTGGSKY